MNPEIIVKSEKKRNRTSQVQIIAQVKDSLHASLLSDRLSKCEYLKVFNRHYADGIATISAHVIPGLYHVQKLHDDLDTMSDLIQFENESIPGNTPQ